MKVKVVKSEKEFPRIMKFIGSPNSERISMITYQGNMYYETILKDPNPLNVGYRQEADPLDWVDLAGEIILSN